MPAFYVVRAMPHGFVGFVWTADVFDSNGEEIDTVYLCEHEDRDLLRARIVASYGPIPELPGDDDTALAQALRGD